MDLITARLGVHLRARVCVCVFWFFLRVLTSGNRTEGGKEPVNRVSLLPIKMTRNYNLFFYSDTGSEGLDNGLGGVFPFEDGKGREGTRYRC